MRNAPLLALMFLGIASMNNTDSAENLNAINTISASDTRIASMGRSVKNADSSVQFAFPGVSFFANFTGKTLSLEAFSSSNNSYLDVYIDNKDAQIIKLTQTPQTYVLLQENQSTPHNLRIVHRSETWQGIVTLKTLSTDGYFQKAPELPTRKILVLGDSVTCGEAIDRVEGETKNSRWWNPSASYGMLTANAVKAQVQLVCYGGKGLVRSWNGKTDEPKLPEFYQDAITSNQKWNQQDYQPDVIISAIGTNDFTQGIPDREAYISTYVKFITQLLIDHKHAQILLTEGAILNGEKKSALVDYLKETIKRVDDKRVHHVKSTHYPGDKTDAHPTKEQHALMAEDLIPQLKTIMKW